MSPRPLRARLLDLAVMTVCVACVAAPILPVVHAAADDNPAVVESGANVDQKVLEAGIISNPLNGSFESGTSGQVDGSIQWDAYSTARNGIKLVVSAERQPALRDPQHAIDIADVGTTPGAWSVAAGDRGFGLTASGAMALERFDDGKKWRGFTGSRSVEVARRGAPLARTRTTIGLRAEYRAALPSTARPTASIIATAVPNL